MTNAYLSPQPDYCVGDEFPLLFRNPPAHRYGDLFGDKGIYSGQRRAKIFHHRSLQHFATIVDGFVYAVMLPWL